MRRSQSAALALILAIYFGLGIASVLTRAPWQDEAWFANPAYNLAYHGFLGTTVLDPASSTWKSVSLVGIDRHTYWVMPLSLLLNAVDFRLFGFGSLQMRLPSLLFGAAFLLAWRILLRRLGAPPALVTAALLLIAVDYHFQMQAADGRMDAMTAALGYGALAVYLVMRERGFTHAVVVSQCLAAAACFTHPNGALMAFLLAVTTVYLDGKRVRFSTLALAASPYLAFAAGWAVYIARDPAAFNAQFAGNAAGRGPTITAPIAALWLEISHRYIDNFGLAAWFSPAGRLNVIPLAILLAGVAICLAAGEIRRHPAYRLILIWTAITVFYLTWFEGLKTRFYLIFLTPLYSVLCAVAAHWLWTRRARWRPAVAAAFLLLMVMQAGRTAVIARRNLKAAAYTPVTHYLRQHFDRRTFIMGDGSLLFGLGPEWNVLDDFRLGYNTGKVPEVIVVDESWWDRIAELRHEHPEIWNHVERLLAGYRQVYYERDYRILVQPQVTRP